MIYCARVRTRRLPVRTTLARVFSLLFSILPQLTARRGFRQLQFHGSWREISILFSSRFRNCMRECDALHGRCFLIYIYVVTNNSSHRGQITLDENEIMVGRRNPAEV